VTSRVAWAGLAGVAAFVVAAEVRAATALQTTVSAREAEVGESIRFEVSALSDGDDSPENPRLTVPAGFSVQGPNISSSQQISFTNGHFEHRRGITATWIVAGTKPGRYVLGPATVESGNKVLNGETVEVVIVPPGQRPQRRSPFDPSDPMDAFDPFGLLRRLGQRPRFDDLDDLAPAPPEAPSEFAVDRASDPIAFLRATVTPSHAVVGEEVRLRVYAYGSRGPFEETNSSEPSRPDFLSEVVVDSSYRQPRYLMSIDGQRFSAVKIREVALFPLKAGTLSIGPMRMGFRGPGYPESRPLEGLVRQSPELRVAVTEPPLAGRPPGYELGDVGTYALRAEVDPRRVEAGGAVSVMVRLDGTGNVPHHLKLPEQRGVDFLEPTTKEGTIPDPNAVRGWREFRYVVRLTEPGNVDLGAVTLPYFDPHTGTYAIARAELGTVEVTRSTAAPAASSDPKPEAKPRDPFEGLGGPRDRLGARARPARHLADRAWFWAALLGAPLFVLLARAAVLVEQGIRRRRGARGESQKTQIRRALADARDAAEKGDAASVASAVERAVYTSLEAALGLKARAVLRAELTSELERRGADPALARDVVKVLHACDELRFGAPSELGPKALVELSEAVVARTQRVTRRHTAPVSAKEQTA
jgi:hypothetical protein